jgi:hypothetical protein
LETPAFRLAWSEFKTHRKQIKKHLTPLAESKALNELVALGEQRAIAAINHTIARGWQGIREPEQSTNGVNRYQTPASTPEQHRAGMWGEKEL